MKSMILACVATITLSAVADGEVMAPEPDWDKICFAISNSCVREERSGKAWMAIAATKLECELSSDQMLNALRLCIEGLGDGPQETRACERIVESMSSLCGTNALPYVEYLIENDRRDGVAYCAYLQFIRMNPDLNRRLFFAEKMLDPKAGRGDGTRIAVYKDLSKIWKQVSKGGDSSNKAKLTWFFERRMALDKDFDHLVPQDFVAARRAAVKKEELDWNSICFMISNRCIRARHPEDAWMTIAAAKIRYKLSPDQMLEAFKRCIEGLGDTLNETVACERIVARMSDNCGTNALPYVEYLIENDRRNGVADCAYRQLVKMEPNLERRLLFAEKILDPKSGRDNCSRIVVYQELRDIWIRTKKSGNHSDRAKLTSFFERRRPLDRDFKYLAPQDFLTQKENDR